MRNPVRDLPPQIVRAIEQRMRPGRFSQTGFLDRSERLVDVIDRDLALLQDVGITPTQIADSLETVVERAFRALEVERGTDYSPRWSTERVWACSSSTTERPERWRISAPDEHLRVVDDPESTLPVEHGGRLYFRGGTCVAIVAHGTSVPTDLEINGATWVTPRLEAGVSAFEPQERRCLEAAKPSNCTSENSGRSGVRFRRASARDHKRAGLPIRRVTPRDRVRYAAESLLDPLLRRFSTRRISDPTFGELDYRGSYWVGYWLCPRSGTRVRILLPGDRRGPSPEVRDFFKSLPDRFDHIVSVLRPRLDEIFRRCLQRPLSASLWDDLKLTGLECVDPGAQPPEWNMLFELSEDGQPCKDDQYLEIAVSFKGDSPQVAIVDLGTDYP